MKVAKKHLYDFIHEHAKYRPDTPALRDDTHRYSYDDLDRISNYFANQLVELDVSGKHVGLVYDQSAHSIILLLSIMKAGAVYVPVDANLPVDRLNSLLSKADIALLIKPIGSSYKNNEIPTVELSPVSGSELKDFPQLLDPIGGEVAYAIFTSGSTGLPKLARLSHSSVIGVMESLVDRYYIEGSDRVLQFANLAFDGSISEIFGAFVAGAELLVPSLSTRQGVTRLSDYMRDMVVDVAVLPPSLLTHLTIDYSPKTVVVAGEPCPAALAKFMVSKVEHFINAYGPTECSICVSTYEVPRNFNDTVVPIGLPLPNVKTLVVGEHGELTKPGQAGELLVGGPSLFEGYYDNPDKTKKSVRLHGGKKYYRTGDNVSEQDGFFVYHSRVGDYIKIHGLRISLLEIEDLIHEFSPKIRSVAVIVASVHQDDELVAFYASNEELPVSDVVTRLRSKLPEYAIPRQFIRMDRLPLSSNGKIDRRLLASRAKSGATLQKPQTGNTLKAIWQNALGKSSINDDTNFLLEGGDSLRAMRVLSEVDRAYATSLTLSNLFDHPTFGEFSRFIKMTSPSNRDDLSINTDKLSEYEKMLWSASSYSGNAAAYTLTELLKPDFKVDIKLLQKAADRMSNHFPASFYRYKLDNGELVRSSSLRGIGCVIRGSVTQDVLDEEIATLSHLPIDTATDSLISLHVFTLDNQTVIAIHAHHIVLSASIITSFIDTLWSLYLDIDHEPQVIESPIPLYDDKDKEFWRGAYDTSTEYVELPWVGARSPTPRNNGRTLQYTLNTPIEAALRHLGVTKYTFFRSIFSLILHQLSDQPSFYVGSSVDVRNADGLGGRPALLNTLPVPSVLDDTSLSFGEFARGSQQKIQEILDHRFLPLSEIVKLNKFEHDRLIGPFNILFDYIEKPDSYTVPGLGRVSSEQVFNDTSKYDLTLTVLESSSVTLQWEYDVDIINASDIERLAAMFIHVCRYISAHPDALVNEIALLGEADLKAALAIGKGEIKLYDQASFYERFVKTVHSYPDRVAVKHGETVTTYRDLGYLVEHYARVLADHHLAPEAAVGVLMERSVEMVAVIVALWRMGHAYVPIEPVFPEHRIRSIIETTHMSLIITTSTLLSRMPRESTAVIVDENYEPSATNISGTKVTTDTLAYVIFTSGSTGKPKGVMIEHGGMMNHADGMVDRLNLNFNSVIAQTASHSFDISVWQLTTILLTGGSLVIYSKDDQANIDTFTSQVSIDGITLLELVPSYISVLLEYIEGRKIHARFESIAALISTGENISWPVVRSWTENFRDIPLINAYGPAEASDDTNLYIFDTVSTMSHRGLPVGKSLPNVDVYVFNKSLQPQPAGVPGEIYISGSAVGRGYVNDEARTKEVFSINPYDNTRLYKTGDMGYWSNDGQLMYLGRSDFQVKIRGFRIELEEIEAHIMGYPDVLSVAVVVFEHNGSKQLHAYLTSEKEIDTEMLLAHLRSRLPDYMVPVRATQLSELPLNNSGKVDRNLLTNKERLRFRQDESVPIQLTKEEADVISVWSEVFGLDHISIDDDYYMLGGDSIASFRVYAKLAAKGYKFPLQAILAHPVARDLAAELLVTRKTSNTMASIKAETALPLTPIQSRLLSNGHKLIAQNVWIDGYWDTQRLGLAIQVAIKRHGAFRLSFTKSTQKFENDILTRRNFTFVEPEVDKATAFDRLGDDLANGELLSYGAVGDDHAITRLYISANHLVIDVVSWSILLADIYEAYDHPNDKAVAIDYNLGRWALYQQTIKEPQEHLLLWRDTLSSGKDAVRILQNKFDDSLPNVQAVNSSVTVGDTFIDEARVYESVIVGLEKILGVKGVSILVESHGRYAESSGVDISRTVGWFTVLYPVAGSYKDIASVLNADDDTRLSYGRLIQSGSLQKLSEPQVIVNYLGDLGSTGYHLQRNRHELPLDRELMEISIYRRQAELIIEMMFYATPIDNLFIERLQSAIGDQLRRANNVVDDDRLSTILRRLEGNS